jgi:chorismate dehydratase
VVKPLRLGVVPYLNVAPIIAGLTHDPRFTIVPEVPSRLSERLRRGEVDLGMIPSIEYAREDYTIVPGIAIGSRGAVGSVLLFHKVPLVELRRVALDESSLTSVALLKILLPGIVGGSPEYVVRPPSLPGMLDEVDGALVIGDTALYADLDCPRLDLGEAWFARTGLPFVYAFWAGRPGAVGPQEVGLLQASLAEGLRSIPGIASSYNGLGRGRGPENEEYLRSRIVFRLGPDQIRGLRAFYEAAHGAGLIQKVPEVRFYEHP